MQHIISAEQAKVITGGRTPLVPVEYEEACKALEACRSLNEAKYWDNKADALAAWAKIYRDGKADREARALKLWAYRRMGELAAELRPTRKLPQGGSRPGAASLLRESGLSNRQTQAARSLALMPEKEFTKIANRKAPPAPTSVLSSTTKIAQNPEGMAIHRAMYGMRSASRAISAKTAARLLVELMARDVLASLVRELIEWLDEFEQHLPKDKKDK